MPRATRWLANLALVGVSLGFAVGTAELVVRLVPALLPAGAYGAGVFSEDLGLGVHGGTLLYNKVRRVSRDANRDGFLDLDHAPGDRDDVFRVGVFGDSYVEAAQVELPETFYRRVAAETRDAPVETLAFGVSGWGTLHSYLAESRLGPRYGLDLVVYVFVENDPGDNSFSIMKDADASTLKPFGVLSDEAPGFRLEWVRKPGESGVAWRLAKWVQQHSRLAQLLRSRISMLRTHGVQTSADPNAAAMTEVAASSVPNSNALPDTWPAAYREEAAEMTRRILVRWRDDLRARGVPLLVFYVPRGSEQVRGELPLSSTWRPWLGRTLEELGVPLVDPTPALAERERAGVATYDDHFSPEGHATVARVLAAAIRDLAPAPNPPTVASSPTE